MLALDDKRTMADWKIKVDEFRPWLSTNCVSVSHVNKSLDEFMFLSKPKSLKGLVIYVALSLFGAVCGIKKVVNHLLEKCFE